MIIKTRMLEIDANQYRLFVRIDKAEACFTLARKRAWFWRRQQGCSAFSESVAAFGRLRLSLSKRVAA